MRLIKYVACTDVNGEIVPPTSSSVASGKKDIWIIPPYELDQIPNNADVLGAYDSFMAIPERYDLPASHPLRGQRVPSGPFNAGTIPGDIRVLLTGGFEVLIDGKWKKYTDGSGDYVDQSGQIEPEPF